MLKFLFISILLLISGFGEIQQSARQVTPSHNGCWGSSEKTQIAIDELDGKVTFMFKDDTTCAKLSNAKVTFAGKRERTDSNGKVSFPISLIENIDNKQIALEVVKSGYITYRTNLDVMVGTVWKNRFLLSKDLSPKEVKFVLEWTENPKDLDLHFKTDSYYIYYGNRNNSHGKANLDRDDVSSFGPETILVKNIDSSKKYEVFVYIYSPQNERLEGKNRATVSVYKNNRLDRVVTIENNGNRKIDILTIENGLINYL